MDKEGEWVFVGRVEEGGADHPRVYRVGGGAFVVERGDLGGGEVEEGAIRGKGGDQARDV